MSSINPVFERLISAERVHIWCQIPMKRVAGAMISIETVITLLPVMAAPCWNNIGKYRLGARTMRILTVRGHKYDQRRPLLLKDTLLDSERGRGV